MNEQLLEREPAPRAAPEIPAAKAAGRTAAPAVFRRQERFWEEVRRRIAENNPGGAAIERLY